MSITVQLRTIVAFAAGVAAAAIALFVFQAMTADAVGPDESTFVAITPCRLFDTRPTSTVGDRNTPIGEDTSATFQVTGTNGDCTIPAAATAVSINLTGATPTAQTNLRMYPADAAVPTAAVLNMSAGQAPLPNKLDVKLSPGGAVAIYNRFGSIHVIGDVMGYYRNDGLAELEARITELETTTASMSAIDVDGHPTVRFTGVNVQVVDGTGDSECSTLGFEDCSGVGNLIVGYNEDSSTPEARTGSHNFIVGRDNDWTSHSGLVTGSSNTISGQYATVAGGFNGTASGGYSSVSGGSNNTASSANASVSGGLGNTASDLWASVSGGAGNTASGPNASVSGGLGNTASGPNASVSGGNGNTASGSESAVSAGSDNIASGTNSSVSGGEQNLASGESASVTGGRTNWATGQQSSVSGGRDHIASGTRTKIVGGAGCTNNTANGVIVGAVTGTTCTQLN